MSVRSHILVMLIATLAAWFAWILVLLNINPLQTQWIGFALFYGTLFLSLFGTLTVLGFSIRSVASVRTITLQYNATTALRQSFLWSCALIIALALQGQRLLTTWIFILLICIFILLEFFFTSYARSSAQNT